ncbi:peptide ABC transporter substrate-binding protein [Sporosarcina sp. 179-K 3D1 HS]|uniref:peptide ABC transporter substrate-binding protein n=1 Tax=Sporosarcina sp. 179-K 3D1 HS TaxID=3232169 RepID=UPI0039A2186E
MKSRLVWLLSLLLIVSAFLAACGGAKDTKDDTSAPADNGQDNEDAKTEETAQPDAEQVLHLIEVDEIPSVDHSISEDAVSFVVLNNVMEGLYRLDQESMPIPAMAEGEPEISDDGKTYTFKIRDAEWSNGTPVTAHDFVYSWQRAIDPDTASPYGPYLMEGMVKNATEIGKGEAEITELGIRAEDEKTLVIELENPIPYFLSLMAFPTFYPLNEEFVKEQGDKYASTSDAMIYNGPFKLADWDGTGNWKYVKNETYWDKDTVKLEEITVDVVKETATAVKLYEQGQIDRAILSAEYAMQYADDPEVVNELETALFYFKMNQERNGKATPLANENIRKAIARAFNKDELAEAVLANGSRAANFLVPAEFTYDEDGKDFREYSDEFTVYNVEEAQEYWKKGLEELGTDKVTLEILGGDTENAKKQQEWFKSELERNLSGLTIKLKEVPFAVRLELDNSSDYEIQSAGWGADFQDPISYLELFTTDSPQNLMGYSNPEFDKLIESTKIELADDPVARYEAFAEAEKILLEDDAAIAPTYQRGRMALMKPYVKGLATHPFGGDYSFKWMYIAGKE